MSDNVINLRQVRKQRDREARRKQAEDNRVEHGRKKAERERAAKEARAQAELLDGHWLGQSRQVDQGDAPASNGPQPTSPDEPKH